MRHAVTENCREVSGSTNVPPSAEWTWINHYHLKSDQDYFEKAARKSVLDTVGIRFETRSSERRRHCRFWVDGRQTGSYPETGLEEINRDLLEADFWAASLKVCPGA